VSEAHEREDAGLTWGERLRAILRSVVVRDLDFVGPPSQRKQIRYWSLILMLYCSRRSPRSDSRRLAVTARERGFRTDLGGGCHPEEALAKRFAVIRWTRASGPCGRLQCDQGIQCPGGDESP
jgi:hypothetical protein